MKQLLSVNEFCAAMNIGRTRTYQLLKQGKIKAKKLGRRTFIRCEDAELWLESLSDYPAEEQKHDV